MRHVTCCRAALLLLACGAAAAAALGAAVAPEGTWTLKILRAALDGRGSGGRRRRPLLLLLGPQRGPAAGSTRRLFADAEGCGGAGCHPDVAAERRLLRSHRFSGLGEPLVPPRPSRPSSGSRRVAPVAGRRRAPAATRRPSDTAARSTTSPPPTWALARSGVALHRLPRQSPPSAARWGRATTCSTRRPLHDLATSSEADCCAPVHEHLVRVDPAAHRRAYARPVLGAAPVSAASCHKSHLDEPVNGKGYLREMNRLRRLAGQARSPATGRASFYFPDRPAELRRLPTWRAGCAQVRRRQHRAPGAPRRPRAARRGGGVPQGAGR